MNSRIPMKGKPLPIVFMVVSVLYFIYVMNMGSSRMIGDDLGGDPGGMVLPLFLAVFMFAASVYLFLTDKKNGSSAEDRMEKADRRLFVLTLVFALAYVLLIRFLGFILCTGMLLFCLCFANMRGTVRFREWKTASLWGSGSMIFLIVLYSLGRLITRSILMAGRRASIPPWMGSSNFAVVSTLAAVLLVLVLSITLSKKRFSVERAGDAVHAGWLSAVIAVSSTELLYIIFRQLFFVELARGLINW